MTSTIVPAKIAGIDVDRVDIGPLLDKLRQLEQANQDLQLQLQDPLDDPRRTHDKIYADSFIDYEIKHRDAIIDDLQRQLQETQHNYTRASENLAGMVSSMMVREQKLEQLLADNARIKQQLSTYESLDEISDDKHQDQHQDQHQDHDQHQDQQQDPSHDPDDDDIYTLIDQLPDDPYIIDTPPYWASDRHSHALRKISRIATLASALRRTHNQLISDNHALTARNQLLQQIVHDHEIQIWRVQEGLPRFDKHNQPPTTPHDDDPIVFPVPSLH